MSNCINRPYPDVWPWSASIDGAASFKGFDVTVPEEGTAISNLAYSMREAKEALNSVVSVPALFACDVEDGDLVIPLPCGDNCSEECDELIKTLRDLGQVPDAVWVPALRETTDPVVSTLSSVDPTTYDPPFYGVAYKDVKRVMVGPVVAHPRFAFHTGDKIYADKNGDLTTTANDTMVGVCLAPGTIYLRQYISSMKKAMEALYSKAMEDTIDKLEADGLVGDNIGVTADGTTIERPLEIRFGDVVNVKDFGAVGDGTTDATNAFNLAIARAQQLGSNVCLFIPAGTYLVTVLPDVPCYGPGSIKYGSSVYSPFELLFKINGAIQKDTNGRFKVDFTKMSEADLAATVRQLLPSSNGGLTTDTNGKLVVDFTQMSEDELRSMIESLLPTSGGLTTDENGQLVVDFSQMTPTQLSDLISQIVQPGGGLSVDESGQIYVDFANMPTNKFEAMLKSLDLAIYLKKNTDFYVNWATGSDVIEDGRGTEAKPFATIQACVNYISTWYNLGVYNATINIADGTYDGFTVPDIKNSGGTLTIKPINANTRDAVIIQRTLVGDTRTITINGTCSVYLVALTIIGVGDGSYPSGRASLFPRAVAVFGVAHIVGCSIMLTGTFSSAVNYVVALIECTDNLKFIPDEGLTSLTNMLANNSTGWYSANALACNNGNIQLYGSLVSSDSAVITITGPYTTVVSVFRGGMFVIDASREYAVSFNGSPTGKRYALNTYGVIETNGMGTSFIPGTTAGTPTTNDNGGIYK